MAVNFKQEPIVIEPSKRSLFHGPIYILYGLGSVEVVSVDPPDGLIYQSELPFERDAVQCHGGKWRYVKLRKAPLDIVAESNSKEEIWRLAKKLSDRPIWEEHYEGMTMVDCTPPPGVFRHPMTCFLVTDDSVKLADTIRPPPHPDSHVRLKASMADLTPAPETPRSASWPEPNDWIKKLIRKL